MIRASLVEPIIRNIAPATVAVEKLLVRYGFPKEGFSDPYQPVPLRHYVAFLEQAAEIIGDPCLGLALGARFRPEELGPVGLLFISSPTLRVGLQRFCRFFSVWQEATVMEVITGRETSTLVYYIEDQTIRPRRQDAELGLAATVRFIRVLLGQNWTPTEVHFEHGESANSAPHREFFRAPVRFGQGLNRVLIANSDLDRIVGSPDQPLVPFFERHLEGLMHEAEGTPSMTDHVSYLIAKRLGRETVSMPVLARELGFSVRTLQRRLAEEGVYFHDLVRSQRRLVAEALLKDGRLAMSNIAHRLSYADAAVLSRAFKAWTGRSPTQFAKEIGS